MKKRNLQLLMLFWFSSFSGNVLAQINVTGVISDDSDELPGVNVVIKGTGTGVVTDIAGKYSISTEWPSLPGILNSLRIIPE